MHRRFLLEFMAMMLHYYEHLSIRPRQLWWMLAVGVAVVIAGSIFLLPVMVVAWSYSLLRFSRSDIRIDDHFVSVGTKKMPLSWFDPSTIGQPRNVWPWFWFSSRRLTCVPFWTKTGVGLKGKNNRGERVYLSLGTNHRDELIAALLTGISRARSAPAAGQSAAWGSTYGSAWGSAPGTQVATSQPGWFADPWDPVRTVRWFDGRSWTGWTAPQPNRSQPSQWWGQ
jgi:Protein of unknown function (DUF2510)